ncbi:unnamed protein product [Mytilus coruscus]|uniref:Endonuclease/exonuclease/phosphatase domain-containing protein n=1 Tax=Mytilus coruscus TaxID=42192 RepID=A0A6J8A4I7_MYTCO|nr:unnamed protein product [Mytilus coruscus]
MHESVTNNMDDVLQKWKDNFHGLLNTNTDTCNNKNDGVETLIVKNDIVCNNLDAYISFEEVYKVAMAAKNGKRPGVDCIQADESSEIDYFLHNLPENEFDNKQVLNNVTENTSDHHPIRMSTKFTYESANKSHAQASSKIKKRVNWDKVDKEWYSAHINLHIDSLQIRENMEETAIEQATSKLCELQRETAKLTSSSKAKFNAKPKLKVWTQIQAELKIARQKYNVWKHHGRANNKSNVMLQEKNQTKKDFRRSIRIEIAKIRNKEKETVLETRVKDTKMIHKLVRNNRKKGNIVIMELEVNGVKYMESENIITGYEEHFRSLATFNNQTDIDSTYHNQVEDDIQSINRLVQRNNVRTVTHNEIKTPSDQ